MSKTITMQDLCLMAETVSDSYGDKTAVVLSEVECLFLQSTGSSHSQNADIRESDAHIYLDIYNPLLLNRGYRIEGMYIIMHPFGGTDEQSWYRISKVVVGQRKLLDNDVNNVHCFLRKVAALEISSVS